MSIKKSRKIWLRNYSIFTSDKSVWESIEKKMETSIQDRQEKPKRGMDAGLKFDINYRLFFQLIGDIAAEYYFLGIYEIDPGIIIKKIKKYLYYLYEKKKLGGTPEKIKIIDKEKKAQFRQLRRIRFEDKTSQINNWFRKRGLDGDIFEEVETGFRLLVYSITGPEKGSELKGPKKRVIEFGPYEDDVIKFCTSTMNPLDLKTWPDTRSRFKEMIGELQSIIQIPKMLSKKIYHLQPLDQYLEKGVNKEPNFSRKIGPLWIDFEPSGYIVERDEVDMIIENLEGNFSQLIIGDMASGKTVIARNVGYKLIKKGWIVYYLPSYRIKHERIKDIVKEIETVAETAQKSLIIIEDLHDTPSSCCDMLEIIKDRGIDIRLLITIRKGFLRGIYATQERIFEPYEKIILEKENFEHVADSIITNFKKIKIQKGEIQSKYIYEYHFESYFRPYIRTLADGNFWVLAYLLEGWSPYNMKLVDYSLIFKKIQKDFVELEKKFRLEDNLRYPVEIILLLAPFSERNLKVSKVFFEDLCRKIGIDYATISRLIDIGEIEDAETDYRLPHQSISQLYMETINYIKGKKEEFPFLENLLALLKNISFFKVDENFELELFEAYLQSKPKNYGKVIEAIGNEMLSPHPAERITIAPDRFKRRIHWKKLFYDEKTSYSLIQVLKEDDNIGNIGDFLFGLFLSTTNAWLIRMYDIKSYSENPFFFKDYYNEMTWGFRGFRSKEDYMDDIEDFLSADDKDKFVRELDPKKVALRVNEEKDIENIRICLEGINVCCEEDFHRSFVENLDLSILKSKLIDEDSYITIIHIIHSLKSMDDRIVTKFKDILVSKVNSETNILHLGGALSVLIRPEYREVFKKVINQIDFNELMSKFENEKDLVGIDFCIPCLKDFIFDEKSIAQRLVDILPPKIDSEKQPARVFRILGEMAVTNELGKNVVGSIISNIDCDLFKSKLKGEHKNAWKEFWDIPVIREISGLKLILDELNIWEVMTNFDIREINRFFDERSTK